MLTGYNNKSVVWGWTDEFRFGRNDTHTVCERADIVMNIIHVYYRIRDNIRN